MTHSAIGQAEEKLPYDKDTKLPIDPYSGLLVEPKSGRLMTKDEAMEALGIPGPNAAAGVIIIAIGALLLDVTGVLEDIWGAVVS